MKALKYIAIAATLLFSSCQTTEKPNKLYEEGISLELAQLRKQEIKELKYGLSFSIPEQKQEAVEGEARISFLLQRPQEIILDFRSDSLRMQWKYSIRLPIRQALRAEE